MRYGHVTTRMIPRTPMGRLLTAALLCALIAPAFVPAPAAAQETAPTAAETEESPPPAGEIDATLVSPTVTKKTSTYQILLLFTFVLAIFLGFELISKVPSQLHTPLMSGANAISGITIVGALLAAGRAGANIPLIILGLLAVACATINVIGGYLVTNRMLSMFKHKEGKSS